MIKKASSILLMLIICITFSACETSLKTPTDLIKRPKLSVKNKIAKEKVNRELPQNASLIRPLKPGRLNSFGYFDLDSDGDDEAYAFYKIDKEQKIGLMLLKELDNEWQLISEVQISGSDISYADFVDFNSDGYMDLLFGSDTSQGVYGLVNAYVWQDDDYHKIWTGEFTKLIVDDMNGDKNKEILCLKHDRNSYSNISAYEYTDKEFKLIDELDMDEYISGYYNVASGDLDDGQKALFMDFNLGSKSATNIIILKNGKLTPVLPLYKSDKSLVSLKDNDIKSKDINHDKIVEIASTYDLLFQNQTELNKKGIYQWKQYRKEGEDNINKARFETVAISYIDKNDFYEFIFPQAWLEAAQTGKLIAYTSSENHKRNFVSYYYLTAKQDTYHILSFEYFDKEGYNSFINSEKVKLYEVIELNHSSDSILIAYYNKTLIPYDIVDVENFSKLVLDKTQIEKNLVYLK